MSTATATDWRNDVREQLADHRIDGVALTHAVVHFHDDGVTVLGAASSHDEAVIASEDWSTKVTGGEVAVHTIADINAAADLDDTRDQAADEPGLTGQDPDAGKLFDVPRVGVIADTTDPTVLKLSFSGSIEFDRNAAADVDFYNRLKAGKSVALELEAHVAGSKTTHRRDSDGNVDAVVQTKSLIIHSLDTN